MPGPADHAPDAVRAAWDQVAAAWDEPTRHGALLALATEHNAFAYIAARYRERAGDPIADAQLEKIRKAATAALFATATKNRPEKTPYKSTMWVLVALVIMLIVGLGYALFQHQRATSTPHDDSTVVPTAGRR